MAFHHWVPRARRDIDARLALMRQVLAAIEYAHARLVACDLKPSNVPNTRMARSSSSTSACENAAPDDDGPIADVDASVTAWLPGLFGAGVDRGMTVTTRGCLRAGCDVVRTAVGGAPSPTRAAAPVRRPPRCSTRVDPKSPQWSAQQRGDTAAKDADLTRSCQGDRPGARAPLRIGRLPAFDRIAIVNTHRFSRSVWTTRAGREARRWHRLGTAFATALVVAIGTGARRVEANESTQQARRAEAAGPSRSTYSAPATISPATRRAGRSRRAHCSTLSDAHRARVR
jgi:hypothetical protein